MRVEIVILNYNGGKLLLECLPSIFEAAQSSRHRVTVTLLENGSNDRSDLRSKEQFPGLKLVRAPANRVLCSYNDYLKDSDCEIAILMNNDIKVDPHFIDPLIRPFEESVNVFMVTPKCLSFDGSKFEGGITQFRMKFGIFWASSRFPGHREKINTPSLTMAAGYGAFDRRKFLMLDGYDDLYLPGRLEDSDLCFRAWKKGWTLLYEPASVVYHKGAVAFNERFGETGTLRINHRNSFLFVWKNVTDAGYLAGHLFWLPFRLLYALVRGQTEFVGGFLDAVPKLREALERRKKAPRSRFSDRVIFCRV